MTASLTSALENAAFHHARGRRWLREEKAGACLPEISRWRREHYAIARKWIAFAKARKRSLAR